MGWIYNLFHKEPKKQEFTWAFEDWEKILCTIHTRMGDGALTIHEIVEGLDVKNPVGKYNFLYAEGFIRKWFAHGPASNEMNMSYLITDKGIRMAEELKGFLGTDGLPKYGDH